MMRIYLGILASLAIISACDSENEEDHGLKLCPGPETPLTWTQNLHESLASAWTTEYNAIFTNLSTMLPTTSRYFNDVKVYAWQDNVDDPYSGIQGGAYIGASSSCSKDFVVEIPEMEIINDDWHRYSVVAHEYFHVWQMNHTAAQNTNDFRIKWVTEGAAALFESLYIQYRYSESYFDAQGAVDANIATTAAEYESYSKTDSNYSSSVYMNLILMKELIAKGTAADEAAALKLILNDFTRANVSNSNWRETFATLYGFSVDDFYGSLTNYSGTPADHAPATDLDLSAVFN